MDDATKELLESMKVTKGARFNAAARLAGRDRRLTALSAFLSGFLIVLTALPYILRFPSDVSDNFNAITMLFSISLLASSLLQYSSGYSVAAEQHHRSGLEINELRRELGAKAATLQPGELHAYTQRLNAILQKYSINHDDLDYGKYQLEHPREFTDLQWHDLVGFRLKILWTTHWPVLVLVLSGGFMLWLVFGYALPARDAISSRAPAGLPSVERGAPPARGRG